MKKDVLERLRDLKPRFADMKIAHMALTGSRARGHFHPHSDVDLLVEFSEPVDYIELYDRKLELEDYLGLPVDLVTYEAANRCRNKSLLEDAIDV